MKAGCNSLNERLEQLDQRFEQIEIGERFEQAGQR